MTTTINAQIAKTILDGTEEVPIYDTTGNTDRKATLQNVANLAPVQSVNGKVGVAILDTDDITEGSTNLYDKDVVLTAGLGVNVTGSYPNFTITNTAVSGGMPLMYISGGIISNDDTTPASLVNITAVKARSSDDTQDIEVSSVIDLDITANASWASGTAPSLTSASIFVWADYNSGSPRYILDDVTGSNIAGAKRRVGVFLTDSISEIIEFISYEKSGGGVEIEYKSEISTTVISNTNYNINVPTGIILKVIGYFRVVGAGGGGFDATIGTNSTYAKTLIRAGSTAVATDFSSYFEVNTSNSQCYISSTVSGTRTLITQRYIDERMV